MILLTNESNEKYAMECLEMMKKYVKLVKWRLFEQIFQHNMQHPGKRNKTFRNALICFQSVSLLFYGTVMVSWVPNYQ